MHSLFAESWRRRAGAPPPVAQPLKPKGALRRADRLSAPASRRLVAPILLAALAAPFTAAAQTTVGARAAPETLAVTQASTPLTLDTVLDAVLRRHPVLEAARARVRAAAGARTTAGLLANPVLAYGVENARLPGGAVPDMPREAMTTATLPLEVLYQRGPRVGRAKAEVRAAEADAATDRQQLALDAAHAYYRLALAQEQVLAGRDLVGWLDTLVAYNRTRAREGAAAEADLLRAGLERDRARAELTMDEVERARAQAELAAFMADSDLANNGRWFRAAMSLSVIAPTTPLWVPSLGLLVDSDTIVRPDTAALSAALATRPEMRAAEEQLAAAARGITLEHRMLLRELGATAGVKQSGGTTSLILGASLPLPLFDQNQGEVARARAERDVRAAELAVQRRTVTAEVAEALATSRLLMTRVEALQHGVAPDTAGYLTRADEARRITLGAYQEGGVLLLQVLDAARTWGEARLTFYRTLYAQHESVLALLAAHGLDVFTALRGTASPEVPQ
jgi:cobalt-zinc-cadmium efflux system outer membrane protein